MMAMSVVRMKMMMLGIKKKARTQKWFKKKRAKNYASNEDLGEANKGKLKDYEEQ